MSPTTPSDPKEKSEERPISTNHDTDSKTETIKSHKTTLPAITFSTIRSAEDHAYGAASSDAMQRWLDQDPRNKPWYSGSRLAGGLLEDNNAKKEK